MKSLQWLQKVGCLKNLAMNLWFLISKMFFFFNAPFRCRAIPPFPSLKTPSWSPLASSVASAAAASGFFSSTAITGSSTAAKTQKNSSKYGGTDVVLAKNSWNWLRLQLVLLVYWLLWQKPPMSARSQVWNKQARVCNVYTKFHFINNGNKGTTLWNDDYKSCINKLKF